VAADTLGVVVVHTLTGIIPEMGFIGTLAHTDFAVDAAFLVPVYDEIIKILADRLEKQDSLLALRRERAVGSPHPVHPDPLTILIKKAKKRFEGISH
jgi:hypothetical protein